MKIRKKARQGKYREKDMLAEGIILLADEMREEESRALTLLLKGVLVYLIVMGGIGCFLTSLDIRCAWWVIHLGVLSGAVFSSFLYYSKRWQNIGYIILFFAMLFTAIWLSGYISSGVFAVANELSRRASLFFGSSALKTYVEQIHDRSVTIPVAMCYVGWVAAILLNVMISRRMRYVAAGVLCMVVLFTPLYLEREPSFFYLLMLFGGLFAVLLFRRNGHYQLSLQDKRYRYEAAKQRITYVYAGRIMFSLVAAVLVFSFVLLCLLRAVLPEGRYARMRSASAMKAGTMDVMENVTLLGIMGLFNYYPSTGGLSEGTLGGVSSVRLDYETDLTAVYVPYSLDRLYLKSFTGADYMPVQNKWSPVREQPDATQKKYQELYEAGEAMSARGIMKITNVAAPVRTYLPYYSRDTGKLVSPGMTQEYTYYRFDGADYFHMEDSPDVPEYSGVPEENREVIEKFCEEAGLKRGDGLDTMIERLRVYFQENIPYTTRPGATPYQKDFVNYFLTENRKGYCAHFASTAALAFREMGFMTRYVEGYVIDPADVSEEGTVLAGEKQEDYYDGYKPLDESAVVSVDITDAGAHAWIEVYDRLRGWRVVDVTPASFEMEEGGGLLQQFFDFLLSDVDDDGTQTAPGQDVTVPGSGKLESAGQTAGIILAVAALAVLLVFFGRKAVRHLLWHQKYRHAGSGDRLIMRYHRYIRHQMRRDKGLAEQLNYREQVQRLVSQGIWQPEGEEAERIVSLLEQAGFSQKPLSAEELSWMQGWFKK